ncbi:MAG: ankyrin repeat domain-containing protein [Bacteroides sp.]|nr:ankyrin repeat domain-containing protein [Prevotella sp.]MCM1407013.1 ankyrin repeat domain-containing protein [Treponema brennaborense]MCM1470164.1 ankyrin repeat domain-containing protein [Bacteroides sp.]
MNSLNIDAFKKALESGDEKSIAKMTNEIEELSFKWTGVRSSRNTDAEKTGSASELHTDKFQNVDGGTFLSACERGDVDFVRAALQSNKSLANTINKDGDSALALAAGAGKKDIVKLLLNNGANARTTNFIGCNALHWALDTGDYDIAALLVNAGADVNANAAFMGTPLQKATARGYYNIVQLLLENGARR